MKRIITLLFLIVPILGIAQNDVLFFSYFKGNGEDGLHLAYSEDGYKWHTLKNDESFLEPVVGESVLMRDPCIIFGPDKQFHMVWTSGWTEHGIGYASSKDLENWSEQKYIEVMKHEPKAKNCWAPEIIYDDAKKQYMIFWSTTIPGRFPETDGTGDDIYNHRMYYVTTKDFESFSATKLLYDHGFNVIDGSVLKLKSNEFVLFLKNETKRPVAEKNIRWATAKNIEGPYTKASEPITGDYWAEGPTCINTGDKYIVYFDKYMERSMGAVESTDLKTWKDISDKISFTGGVRHGTVFRVPEKLAQYLIQKYR
ncbi:glycoside hydrolase family 43 protein [Prolixibacteraceae bacterium Z1-6]|uniref:Glycoside hydrolase family 43 protein n=1 Tax=Draconibacterium aestuarii TaxID=2998507 RepID=A0A9X3F8X8_9BACT|nr:glycoside hydrolase family 43 protein [Prolixibacteraceae bacterium Z1-6]